MFPTRLASVWVYGLWLSNTLVLVLNGYWWLTSSISFVGRIWIAAGSILIGFLVILCAWRLIGAAALIGVTGAMVAITANGWLAVVWAGHGAVVAFATGIIGSLLVRRLLVPSRRSATRPDHAES